MQRKCALEFTIIAIFKLVVLRGSCAGGTLGVHGKKEGKGKGCGKNPSI